MTEPLNSSTIAAPAIHESTTRPRPPLVRLSGLWQELDKNGDPYWYGLVNNRRRWYIFKNRAAKTPFDPPFILFEVAAGADDGEA